MRLFDLSESITQDLNEVTWSYRLHLTDIFKRFQSGKLTLEQATTVIIMRITEFLNSNSTLDDDAKVALKELSNKIKETEDIDQIDDLIGNDLFDIADKYSIQVK